MLDAWLDLVHGSCCVGCGRPGRLLCPACSAALPRQPVAVRPTPCPDGLAPCRAAGEYAGLLRALVLAHKEHRAFALARPLGDLLARVVGSLPAPAGGEDPTLLLVPVPSRPGVVRERGHDPMLRVARAAAGRLRAGGRRAEVVVLLRQRLPVGDQAGLTSGERAANLRDSLAVRADALRALGRRRRPVTAVVCDDVLTTGATAREAQRALEDVGLPVAAVCCVAATRKRVPAAPAPLPFWPHSD